MTITYYDLQQIREKHESDVDLYKKLISKQMFSVKKLL